LHNRSNKSVKDFIQENKIPSDKYDNMPQFAVQSKEIGNHKSKFLDDNRSTQSCPPNKRSLMLYNNSISTRLSSLIHEVDNKLITPDRNIHKLNLSRQISQNETSYADFLTNLFKKTKDKPLMMETYDDI